MSSGQLKLRRRSAEPTRFSEPADEIIKWVEEQGCDLVAMSTHGHRFLADLFFGTTVHRVRHTVQVPVLLLRHR